MELARMLYEARRSDVLARRRLGRAGRLAYRALVKQAARRIDVALGRGYVLVGRNAAGHLDIRPVHIIKD